MAVRDEDINITYVGVLQKLDAERAQSCSRIENEHTVAAANFDARSISAIPDCRWTGTRDATSDAPEPNPHGSFQHSTLPENLSNRFYLEWAAMSSRTIHARNTFPFGLARA